MDMRSACLGADVTILRLSPRLSGKQVHVLIRIGEKDQATKSAGLLTFTAGDYRLFLTALKQGAGLMSPDLTLLVDNVQLGGV